MQEYEQHTEAEDEVSRDVVTQQKIKQRTSSAHVSETPDCSKE